MSDTLDGLTKGNWNVRRPLVLATLAFCALQLAYLTVWGADTGLAQTMAIGAYSLAGSTLGSYLFAATWDTKNLIIGRAATNQPYGYGQPPMYDQFGQPMQPSYGAYPGNPMPVYPPPPPPVDDRPR